MWCGGSFLSSPELDQYVLKRNSPNHTTSTKCAMPSHGFKAEVVIRFEVALMQRNRITVSMTAPASHENRESR